MQASGSLLLLAGDRLTAALAATGVGPRALTAHRKPAAVPATLVRPDLDLAADVRGHLAPEVTFDLVVAFDPVPELDQLVVAQLVDALVRETPVFCSVSWARVRPTPKM